MNLHFGSKHNKKETMGAPSPPITLWSFAGQSSGRRRAWRPQNRPLERLACI
jgi:hypothetical protein